VTYVPILWTSSAVSEAERASTAVGSTCPQGTTSRSAGRDCSFLHKGSSLGAPRSEGPRLALHERGSGPTASETASKGLERENATLKRLLADAELEKVALKEIAKGNF
jgi:hypothetical protein